MQRSRKGRRIHLSIDPSFLPSFHPPILSTSAHQSFIDHQSSPVHLLYSVCPCVHPRSVRPSSHSAAPPPFAEPWALGVPRTALVPVPLSSGTQAQKQWYPLSQEDLLLRGVRLGVLPPPHTPAVLSSARDCLGQQPGTLKTQSRLEPLRNTLLPYFSASPASLPQEGGPRCRHRPPATV